MTDRPQEIRSRTLANWRVKTTKRLRSAQARREGNSERHLESIRQLPCCVCLKPAPSDPHHLKSQGAAAERAFGRRATDRRTVPLCRFHHDGLGNAASHEMHYFTDWGLPEVHELAEALWNAAANVDARTKIILAYHWGEGAK
jgi:hypothetical protein